jgi:hypothetical protein
MIATRPPMVASQSHRGTFTRCPSGGGRSGGVERPEVSPVDADKRYNELAVDR